MNPATTLATTLAITLLTVVAPAQTPTSRPSKIKKSPHNIKMDALSRATLDRWESMEYHLGRAGVKIISFTVKVETMSMFGDATATGKYTFNGKKGSLKWDNAALGDMLATRGWSRDTFDRMFIPDSHRRELANTELTAEKKGDTTVVRIKGETKAGYKSFHYDKLGVGKKFTMVIKNPEMGDLDAVVAVRYDKIGNKYVRSGWSIDLDMPMGAFRGTVKIKNKRVGKYHVYGTVTEQQTMGEQSIGNTTLTFTDYKINGAITEPKKPETTPKATSKPTSKPTPKPASKPASKPGKKTQKGVEKGHDHK
jgi:hypothetical protein